MIGDLLVLDMLVGLFIYEVVYCDMVVVFEWVCIDGGEVIGGDCCEVGLLGVYYVVFVVV